MYKTVADVDADIVVSFTFDGMPVSAQRGMSLAAALLSNGVTDFRKTPVSGTARGPFCMMGTCYDCLVCIDGVTVQACQTYVESGIEVFRVAIDNNKAL